MAQLHDTHDIPTQLKERGGGRRSSMVQTIEGTSEFETDLESSSLDEERD